MKRWSSTRRTACPMPNLLMAASWQRPPDRRKKRRRPSTPCRWCSSKRSEARKQTAISGTFVHVLEDDAAAGHAVMIAAPELGGRGFRVSGSTGPPWVPRNHEPINWTSTSKTTSQPAAVCTLCSGRFPAALDKNEDHSDRDNRADDVPPTPMGDEPERIVELARPILLWGDFEETRHKDQRRRQQAHRQHHQPAMPCRSGMAMA